MTFSVISVVALLASASMAQFVTSPVAATTACPTVTTTASLCSTCVQPQCVETSIIEQPCGCPIAVPTAETIIGCDQGCPGGCAATEYVTASPPIFCPAEE